MLIEGPSDEGECFLKGLKGWINKHVQGLFILFSTHTWLCVALVIAVMSLGRRKYVNLYYRKHCCYFIIIIIIIIIIITIIIINTLVLSNKNLYIELFIIEDILRGWMK